MKTIDKNLGHEVETKYFNYKGNKVPDLGKIKPVPIWDTSFSPELFEFIISNRLPYPLFFLTEEGEVNARNPYLSGTFYLTAERVDINPHLNKFVTRYDRYFEFILWCWGTEGSRYIFDFDVKCINGEGDWGYLECSYSNNTSHNIFNFRGGERKIVSAIYEAESTGMYHFPLRNAITESGASSPAAWELYGIKVTKFDE